MSTSGKALVVKLSSLGDLFHALPAVHALKQHLQLEIDWITQPEYAALVACFTDVRRVLTFPRRRAVRDIRHWFSALRADGYDYVFDFQGLLKSGFISRCARSARRIGPSYQREGARWFYTEVAGPPDRDRHAVEQAMDTAHYLGCADGEPVFPVCFPEFEMGAGAVPRVGYVIRSRWPTKDGFVPVFGSVMKGLHGAVGGEAHVLGAREDAVIGEELAALARGVPVRNWCGKTTLVELGGLIQKLDLLVTVDSGPMHMAAAVGVPTVALFGPTNPARTGPYGASHRIVQRTELACVPCYSRRCKRPQRDHACLRELDAEQVVAAAEVLLRM
jgi:heptosyltransferase I